ncbi:zinc finger CCCH domain-containing protein 55-like isoform X1 [Gossypium australe]|uniref:Zinc finger CCCH domain-containing protein 55-like isoform X1 n=1 Tax=Gossypium australe TaxID=47621 RepID=A0A5B6UFR6_9ROSI|nr:zinc finger CCCH domain-containing protein 55-like isoform X1 [Gossypium australe]
MDLYDTTNVLFTKIKVLDPENASKIMGYILIQDLADRDLLRLAYGPDSLLHSLVLKAKAYLGLSSNTFSTPSLNPISRPNNSNSNNSQNPLPPSSPTLIPRNGFLEFSKKAPSWSPASSPKSSPFLSYESIRSGSLSVPPRSGDSNTDFIDETQMSDYFSFLNDSSSSKNEDFVGHRRSFSASDACFGTAEEAGGFGGFMGGYKPCLYFARGFCKNGDNCKFSHGPGGLTDNVDVNGAIVGSPSKMDFLYHQHEEIMRVRAAAAHQRLAAAQLMGGASSPLPYEKNMNVLLQHQTDAQRAAALMYGEETCKFSQGRAERNDYFAMGLEEKANSASKQIYLTFPADSTFKDEDVSNYFRRQHLQQQFERGNFSPCSSPSGLDSRESHDLHLGAKMFYNAREMMLRRELEEQADLQQAIELQRRRFMNLQLPDFKNDGIHHFHHCSLSVGASVPSSDSMKQEVSEVNGDNTAVAVPLIMNAAELEEVKSACVQKARVGNSQESSSPKGCHESSVEHALPDSPFASPKKPTENNLPERPALVESNESSALCAAASSSENDPLPPITSTSKMASV